MLKPDAAVDIVKLRHPAWRANRDRMDLVDRWYRGQLSERDKPRLPAGKTTQEYRDLRDRAVCKFLKLAVNSLAQAMYIDGYRAKGESDNAPAWDAWQANRWDHRQTAVYRGMLAHGLSYMSVLPGVRDGAPLPVWKGHSARSMLAFWMDEAADEWPIEALSGDPIHGADGRSHWRWRLYDADAIHVVDSDAEASKFVYITSEIHNVGVCPVIRYSNELDLDGRSSGEVEPNIDLAARLDQDTFDRLVVQRFGAWVVRTIAGMVMPELDEDRQAEKLRLSIEDFLASESPDTKFGTLEATPLDGFIKAKEADVYEFGAVMQVPASDLIGQMVNMSAEALAAGEAGKSRKVTERKQSAGESAEQALRLTAQLMGDLEGAADFGAQVVWRDMEARSLSSTADALGKLSQMLGIPPQGLWERIPGVTARDIEEWKKLAAEQPLMSLFDGLTAGQSSFGV